MEEDLTQPATQIVIDPRRLGQANSSLSPDDRADICCILVPASKPAIRAVNLIYEQNPHLTLASENNVRIRERDSEEINLDETSEDARLPPRDLVLRLSAKLKDPIGGFYFGRNKTRCDFQIGYHEESKRVSNVHFRIYINEHGTLMLEDQSTNGTAVDGFLLRGKEKENDMDYRHTLESGSVIILTMTPPEEDYRFTVRIPQRDDEAEDAYQTNLTAFFLRNNDIKQQNHARLAAGGVVKDPVNLFPTPGSATPNPSMKSSRGKVIKEWRGGPKYNRVSMIGKGAFAVVYKITAKFDGVPYAAKELEKRRFMKNGVLDQKVEREMEIMRQIKHPNVVQYIEHVDWHDYLYIIMEFVPGGDLGSMISEQGYLSELSVKTMASQLLSALKYLHAKGITHRDVKPDNILINSQDPFHVKLTDFGLSKMIDSEETFLRTFCGTLLYCAPEVYSEYREYDHTGKRNYRGLDKKSLPPQRYGHTVDIWSTAGVLFYALCGSPPYPVKNGTSYQELLNQIMTQPLDIRPLQLVNISQNGIRFVRGMLHTRPEYRATIEQLEQSSWFGGVDSFEMSMNEDEVDMIDDGYNNSQLEEGTSQLSINPEERRVNDSQESHGGGSELTELQPPEIPSSFSTDDDFSTGGESFAFLQDRANSANGRLFGEVDVSALGSSGAIPLDQFNLPYPSHQQIDFSQQSRYQSQPENAFPHVTPDPRRYDPNLNPTNMPTNMPPPPPPKGPLATQTNPEEEDRTTRSSSLLGAESMVGHLNMHSPASAASPAADSPMASTELLDVRDPAVSLRRPREEYDDEDDVNWRPVDLPPKRQRRSSREIELQVPPSIFWDPKDKSTHHNNYPRMSTTDFHAFQQYALSKGEKFLPGQKTFETTMQSFRSSMSPSFEPDPATRAYSEPTKEEGRRLMMKRDERKLVEALRASAPVSKGSPVNDENVPPTAHSSGAPRPSLAAQTPREISQPLMQPSIGNYFQQPKRIIAKLSSTRDSILPTINLNIIESVTSWGRGVMATVQYPHGAEVRVPKYAFKIIIFKPGFYTYQPREFTDRDQDMKLYISTKASQGIWLNGTAIPSHEVKHPTMVSKYWTELRHGDEITIWHNDKTDDQEEQNNRLRFECYWGQSKEPRRDAPVDFIEDGPFLDELERVCMSEEHRILKEKERRRGEEERIAKHDKEVEKLARRNVSRPVDVNKPLSGAPSFSG